MPIMAVPASFMTVRMSAKSRLMRPGMVMRSVTPWMPWRSVSSAMRKASTMEVFLLTISSRRSFGMTMSVSTLPASKSTPWSAWLQRTRPSKLNGLVTMPTVSAPISSRAISATMGAAPVPVPPPSPAVTNTMSASASASRISARDSSAAWQPTEGSAPAPRPLVSSSPMWIVLSASDIRSAWRSVFTAMNSTPRTPVSTMRLTALVPAPPTPTTLITARWSPEKFGISFPPVLLR